MSDTTSVFSHSLVCVTEVEHAAYLSRLQSCSELQLQDVGIRRRDVTVFAGSQPNMQKLLRDTLEV